MEAVKYNNGEQATMAPDVPRRPVGRRRARVVAALTGVVITASMLSVTSASPAEAAPPPATQYDMDGNGVTDIAIFYDFVREPEHSVVRRQPEQANGHRGRREPGRQLSIVVA